MVRNGARWAHGARVAIREGAIDPANTQSHLDPLLVGVVGVGAWVGDKAWVGVGGAGFEL